MDKSDKQWPVVLGLVIAIIGVIAPILWDVFRSNADLELKETGRTVIIQRNDVLDKLRVEYGGQPIKELSSIRFEFANTGSKPFRDSDLVTPPAIHFQGSHLILDARIESKFPENLVASITRDPNSTTVALNFPLLNPGENVRFVVLIADSSPVTFQADARIVGLSKLKVTRQSEVPARAGRRPSWGVYMVGAFSTLLLLGAVVGLTEIPKEQRFKKLVREGGLQLSEGMTKETAALFAASQLSWTTSTERKPALSYVDALPKGQTLGETERSELVRLMGECSSSATPNLTVVIIVSLISVIGFGYVLAQVL